MSVEMNSGETIQLSKNPTKLVIWGILLLGAVWIVQKIFITVLIFSLALLLAYLITPAVIWICSIRFPKTKKTIPWALATLAIYAVLSAVLMVVIASVTPIIMAQVNALVMSAPLYLHKIDSFFSGLLILYHNTHFSPVMQSGLHKYGSILLEKTSPIISDTARKLTSGILEFFSAVLIFLSAFIFSLYIVLDQKHIKRLFLEMFPSHWHSDTESLLENVGKVVGYFIRGMLILSVMTGAGTYLAFLLLQLFGIHFEYALLAALFIGLLYPIPFVGTWGTRVAVPLLAYLQTGNPLVAIWVFIAVLGVGGLVDGFVLPVVLGKGIGISPLMVLFAVFAGGELFGFWGLILSIPAAAVIRLLFVYIQKHVSI